MDPETNVCSERSFREVYDKVSQDLFNFLYYKFGSDNNPGDLVQEAFAKLWNNCSKVSPEKARSYLFTIANNQMLNELDKKKTVLNYRNRASAKNYTVESPQFVMEEEEYLIRLEEALESLSEAQRVAFLLNRIEGKRHKEIAEILGISRKAVEKRIYGALASLREKLGEL